MNVLARIATVSLNPAIDQTAAIPNFTAGAVNRVERQRPTPAARASTSPPSWPHFGLPVRGHRIPGRRTTPSPSTRLFADKGIVDRFVRVPGARGSTSRSSTRADQVTDINFPGLTPNAADLEELMAAVDGLCSDTAWFVFSGSVPAGLPADIYADLVQWLKARGNTVLLDASGPPFAAAIPCGPDVIKPNIDELQELVAQPLGTEEEIVDAAREIIARGIGLVAVSMGPDGALFVEADAAVLAMPPKITCAAPSARATPWSPAS